MTRRHAVQDLTNALNRKISEIERIEPGGALRFRFELAKYRKGVNSIKGEVPSLVSWRSVTVTLEKLEDGTLHLVHFSPRI